MDDIREVGRDRERSMAMIVEWIESMLEWNVM